MAVEQDTAEDLAEDVLAQMARIWRKLRRRWENFKSRGSSRTSVQRMRRAAIEAYRDFDRFDEDFHTRTRDVDPREKYQEVDRRNREELRNLDRDGNGVDDRIDARNRRQKTQLTRDLQNDINNPDARPEVIDADFVVNSEAKYEQDDRRERDERAADERTAEERRERESRERDSDGVDVGTAAAAGGAAAVANEVDEQNRLRDTELTEDPDAKRGDVIDVEFEVEQPNETKNQADNQQQTETDSDLEAGPSDEQVGTAETAADGTELSSQLRDEIQQDVDAQQASEPVLGDNPRDDNLRDQEQDRQFTNPDGTVNQEALEGLPAEAEDANVENDFDNEMAEAEQRGTRAAEYEAEVDQLEASYADDGVLSTETGLENEPEEQRFVNEDGSVNQTALNGGQEQDSPEQDRQFVNADGSVNQAALNGQDSQEQEHDERQGEIQREPGQAEVGGFPTGGDQAAAAKVEEATARDVETDQDGRSTVLSGQEVLDKVIAEEQERQGGRHRADPSRQGQKSVADLEELRETQQKANRGVVSPDGAPRVPVGAGVGGRGGQTPGQRHEQVATRSGGPADGHERTR